MKSKRTSYLWAATWTDCSQFILLPLIILIAKEFNIPNADAGTITYLTQAGYAIGLFFDGSSRRQN
jgi:hypothetical protein